MSRPLGSIDLDCNIITALFRPPVSRDVLSMRGFTEPTQCYPGGCPQCSIKFTASLSHHRPPTLQSKQMVSCHWSPPCQIRPHHDWCVIKIRLIKRVFMNLMHLQTGELRDNIPWIDNFQRIKCANRFSVSGLGAGPSVHLRNSDLRRGPR